MSLVYIFLRSGPHDPLSSDALKKPPPPSDPGASSITNHSGGAATARYRPHRTGILFTRGTTNNNAASSNNLTPEEQARLDEAFGITANLSTLLDDGDDTEALIEARKLATNPNPDVRMAVLQALKWIGSSAAADIASFMGDDDPEISQSANEAFWDTLDEIDDPQLTIEMLKIPLTSPSSAMRQEAVDRLVFLPEQLAFPVIASMLNDSDLDVRNLAKGNLEFISSEEFDSEAQAMAWFNLHKGDLEQAGSL